MNHATQQLDTSIEIVTPENIAFRYRVAGPFRRLLAWFLDLAVYLLAGLGGMIALGLTLWALRVAFGMEGAFEYFFGLNMVLWFVLSTFYGGVFESLWNGQTPGKRITRLRVVTVDGQPINGLQAILRNILRIVDMQPVIFYQVGLWAAAANPRGQRLGDLAAGTMVVVEEHQWLEEVARFQDPQIARMAAAIPGHFQPSRSLARALAVYVQRRANFSFGRRIEIARHLAGPLCVQFGFPANLDPDLVLCSLYHRVFVTEGEQSPQRGVSPFRQPSAKQDPVAEWLAAMKPSSPVAVPGESDVVEPWEVR